MKKMIGAVLSALLILNLSGCGVEIEDTNGTDDFSLVTLTDENIINRDTGASGASYSEKTIAGLETKKYYSKNFSGVEEIWFEDYLMATGVSIEVDGLKVTEGNFRMCVLLDDEIIHEFALNEEFQTFELDDFEGCLSVRIAGESAVYEFYMNVY